MKRFLTLTLTLVFTLGLALSAQAVNIDLSDGNTANSAFGSISGVKFVNDQNEITKILTDNASTYFNLTLIGKASDYKNSIGSGEYSNYKKFSYADNFDKGTGAYKGNGLIKEDVLLSDISFEAWEPYVMRYVYGIDELKVKYANRDPEYLYDTTYYADPTAGGTYDVWPKLQLYIVTDDMVEINGNVFYKGSLIFCLDDGMETHIDFNDLVFALGAKNPPVVPIPGAAILLAPGLMGLAALRRKMK